VKGTSEARARVALKAAGLFVYKPPDDARNWKPCDFLTWQAPKQMDLRVDPETGYGLADHAHTVSRWIEVKQIPSSALTMAATGMRPSQRAGVAEAMRLRIPYWLLIFWKHPKIPAAARWTCLEMTRLSAIVPVSLPYRETAWVCMGTLDECVEAMIE